MTTQEKTQYQVQIMRDNFRRLREAKGWTIEMLSAHTGIDPDHLRAIESGGDFRMEYLIRLCRLYRIEPAAVFGPLPFDPGSESH